MKSSFSSVPETCLLPSGILFKTTWPNTTLKQIMWPNTGPTLRVLGERTCWLNLDERSLGLSRTKIPSHHCVGCLWPVITAVTFHSLVEHWKWSSANSCGARTLWCSFLCLISDTRSTQYRHRFCTIQKTCRLPRDIMFPKGQPLEEFLWSMTTMFGEQLYWNSVPTTLLRLRFVSSVFNKLQKGKNKSICDPPTVLYLYRAPIVAPALLKQ